MRRPSSVVIRGGLAGILAATALALWFLLVDALQGRPLYTPAFLASVLLGFEQVRVSTGLVALYTLLHYAAFTLLGIVMAELLPRIRIAPNVLLGAVLGFLLFDVAFYSGCSSSRAWMWWTCSAGPRCWPATSSRASCSWAACG